MGHALCALPYCRAEVVEMFMLVPHPLTAVQSVKRSLIVLLQKWGMVLPAQVMASGYPSKGLRDIGVGGLFPSTAL